eukprot:TRINITY_DN4054_c0_g1_i2.p1 TRINITY_DN4054_c0_g1~~TRINITY_DN4054_c0_g1_i2.p1  ORF type:complete len:151 (+),score=40.17 TRINITY_DN4054_c0_g1_i2:169-621(+)
MSTPKRHGSFSEPPSSLDTINMKPDLTLNTDNNNTLSPTKTFQTTPETRNRKNFATENVIHEKAKKEDTTSEIKLTIAVSETTKAVVSTQSTGKLQRRRDRKVIGHTQTRFYNLREAGNTQHNPTSPHAHTLLSRHTRFFSLIVSFFPRF